MTRYANRGKSLETMIEHTVAAYRRKGKALIHKIPNAWIVQRAGKRIVSAFPEKKSTVDFAGVLPNGRAIAFEAKSTANRTSFPLSMIEAHQIEYLRQHLQYGGISFFLVEFSKLNEVYLLPFEYVEKYLEVAADGGRKSIPYPEIVLHCERVKSYRGYVLHFLKYVVE